MILNTVEVPDGGGDRGYRPPETFNWAQKIKLKKSVYKLKFFT